MDFLIPFASSLDAACQAAIKTLQLPNLTHFLKRAEVVYIDRGDEFDFIAPHERVLGLTQHVIVTPCHWSVGIDNICMDNPENLQLTDSESKALLATVSPYFESDSITLKYQSPLCWEAIFSMDLQSIHFASLDRVIGRNVDVWQPHTSASKDIRRLQNEIQMLLYTHPINEAREARGLPTVNSFWLNRAANVDASFDFSLRDSALCGDWQTWGQAWQTLDAKLALATQITLCGERHAATYAIPQHPTILQKLKRFMPSKGHAYEALLQL